MNVPHGFDTCDMTFVLGCPLNCKYCPQDLFIKKYNMLFKENNDKIMTTETFKNVLKKFNKTGCIVIGGFSEAFMNNECSKMISYAASEGYRLCLNTTLVGMNSKDIDLIKHIPFVDNVLHIPDKYGNSRFKITDSYLSILKEFTDSGVEIGCYSCHGEVHPDIFPYLDSTKKIINSFNDRAGNVNCKEIISVSTEQTGKLACLRGRVDGKNVGLVGFSPIILPNGYGVMCCSDWGLQHVLGNFATQEVEEIISGKEYRLMLRAMDDDTLPLLCRKCTSAVKRDKFPGGECSINLLSGNAIKVGLYLDDYKNGRDLSFLPEHAQNILARLAIAKQICIYGLGKLFHDNFFASHWNEVLIPHILCDGDSRYYGQYIEGIPCVDPESLPRERKEDLLVITYVRDDSAQRENLKRLGINNVLNIYEIFNMFD